MQEVKLKRGGSRRAQNKALSDGSDDAGMGEACGGVVPREPV